MPISTLFLWLLLVWAAGWLAFPVARRLTGHALPDGGLALGRIGFLVVWALLSFWLGHIGVAVAVCAGLYVPLAVLGVLFGWRDQVELRTHLRARRRAIMSVEAIFLFVFLVFFVLRGYWSDTNPYQNGEKSMDSALIGTLARAQSLPPENPYAAGARLSSYYIFGHLQTALLTRASNTSVRWSYNLMCATLPALCFPVLFSLGAGMTRRLDGGVWVSGTILGLGTLQPLYQWFNPDGLIAQHARDPNVHLINNLDFFAVSRPIPNAIDEFPWFTFNQADLHAHYFDFPIEIALMALAWTIFRAHSERKRRVLLGVAAMFLGAQILTNTWDFPAYALAVGLAFFLAPRDDRAFNATKLARLMAFGGAPIGAVALASPYLLGINTAARGPSPLLQPASPLREWLLMWGPIAASWFGFCAWRTFRFDARWRWALGAFGVFTLVAAVGQNQWGYPPGLEVQPTPTLAATQEWFGIGNPARLIVPLIVWSVFVALVSSYYNRGVARFLPLLALAGLFSLLWSETTWAGFLGDPNFVGFADAKRQDTVFKFSLQAWFLWGTAASTGAYLTLNRWPKVLRRVCVPFLFVMALSSYVDTLGRTHGFDFQQRQNWDAWAHIKPAEQEAAQWLQNNTPPDVGILEAEDKKGGDYSPYTRYAQATGIATIIGPQAHTFQWSPNPERVAPERGDTAQEFIDRKAGVQWEEVGKRKAQAREAFTTQSASRRRDILKHYNVRFVVWGELEREQYGKQGYVLLERDLRRVTQFGFDSETDPVHRVEIFQVD